MPDSESLKRPRFFAGKLLSPADFKLEQQYIIEKFKRHNRSLHGFGIVSGLKVTVGGGELCVAPGLALDCAGNELVVACGQSIPLSLIAVGGPTAYANLVYAEEDVDPLPAPANEAANVIESFAIEFSVDNCNRGHRHLRGRWLPCGQPHALTIAKLKRSTLGWRVERGYRPPVIK